MVRGSVCGEDLEQFVAAFEAALDEDETVDLGRFLPEPSHPLYTAVLAELVRVDLEYRWRLGTAPRLDDYLRRFPCLAADQEHLAAVTFEEYRLRQQAGQAATAGEYQARYGVDLGAWPLATGIAHPNEVGPSAPTRRLPLDSGNGRVSLRMQQTPGSAELKELARSDPASALRFVRALRSLPEVGERFLDFELISELGRGAFGRVFLARQGHLADRPVALKIATDIGAEASLLAQLQHTNIVPIHSVHQAEHLHAVCMPYLGSVTLADVLRALRGQEDLPDTGRRLVATMHGCKSITQRASTDPVAAVEVAPAEAPGPADSKAAGFLKTLEGFTYVEAVLWIGARLADGLAHAHERGILHRDLKPANILLTDDGQPLLLDFNLSEDTKARTGAARAFIGGTLPYMSPEHLTAFLQREEGIDGRSDIYSLGVILYELLAGRHPFAIQQGRLSEVLPRMIEQRRCLPNLEHANPAMTPAVAAILRRCLAPDPAERYQSARALQDDLERHLAHLPLRHTPEPSWRERVRKWARRHPRVTSASTVAAVAAVVLLGLGGLVLLREERLARVEAADQYRRFQQAARSVQVEFLGAPAGGKSRLAAIETSCRRALELYGADSAADWTERPEVTRLGADVQARLREEVGELLLLLAATVALEEDAKALDFNARALSCSSPDKVSPAVYYQRAALLEQRGRKAEAAQARLQYEAAAPHTPRDQCLLACIRMLEGRARAARPLWEEATRLDPTNLWAWYGLGDCYDRLDKPAQASACYTACIALAPQVHDWHFRRGLAQLRNNEPAAACSDLTVAHRLRPDHRETLVNRALAHLALRDSKAACADLDGAVGLGGADARLYLMRARARDLAGDSAGAASDRQASTHVQPADELAWVARGAGRTASAPEAALADFDQALAHNPRCLAALQSKAHVLAEKLARTEEAIKVLDRAVALYPEHAPARAARGTLLARLGNCDAAHADAAEALAAEPRSPEVVYQVAGIYAQTSRRHPEDRRHALALLAEACRHNFGYDLLTRDADLDPLRDAPEFQRLAQAVRSLQEASSAPDGKAGEGAR